MPTRRILLPGSRTGRRAPVDVGYVHWCAESCLHLDPVDRQIVIHLVHGKSNQQIGDSVCLSESAVKSRLEGVMRKLGVDNRTELAVLALKTGIE
jgi:DNA-binding NarL/FixJ family response regulator